MDWTPARIRALRKRLGYDQAQMAEALGYSRRVSVSDLETGRMEPGGAVLRLLEHLDARGDVRDRREGTLG